MTFSQNEILPPLDGEQPPSWQLRALDRSLGDSRARSVARLSQFVAAARALAEESGSSAFTVQQVVARSGQSLKSFYRYFASKDDLLLALLEEDIAVGAIFLGALIDEYRDPVERVHEWLVGLFGLMSAGDQGYVSVLVREHQRLVEKRSDQIDVAIAPFLDLLASDIQRCVDAGAIRGGDARRDAQLIFQLSLGAIHEQVFGRDDREPADVVAYLWQFCWGGLAARADEDLTA